MKNLIIIPAFNEEKNLQKTINLLKKENPQADILLINDGSTDKTKEIAQKNGIKVISNQRNLGKSATFFHGVKYAIRNKYNNLITIDADIYAMPKNSINELVKTTNYFTNTKIEQMVVPYQIEREDAGYGLRHQFVGFRGFSKKALIRLYKTKTKKFTTGFGLEMYLGKIFNTNIFRINKLFITQPAFKHGKTKQQNELNRMQNVIKKKLKKIVTKKRH